jgi:hypothetical protein
MSGKDWEPGGTMHFKMALQHGLCFYCGEPFESDKPNHDPLSPSREHLVRKVDGGGNHPDNIVVAHKGCNSGRGEMPWQVYKIISGNKR